MRMPSLFGTPGREVTVGYTIGTLAKACVLFLVRQGAWRNDKYLRNNTPTPGRVWDRIPLDERALQFSRPVLDFLLWLTAEKVHETKQAWDAAPKAR